MMNPAFDFGLLHVPLQINGIPVFLIEMECRSDSLVAIPQLLRVIGGTLQGNMRLVGIQPESMEPVSVGMAGVSSWL